MPMASALQRLKVVDLSSHLSGPYCAMLLADHGADVIKIERPDSGDDARAMPPFVAGESAPFMIWNRNSIRRHRPEERDRQGSAAQPDR